MRPVVVESPYAGDVSANVAYARRCLADCLRRGEAPFASHLLYTQEGVLDDVKAAEREIGIASGFAWLEAADADRAFYVDRGFSRGMKLAVDHQISIGDSSYTVVFFRSLEGEVTEELLRAKGAPDEAIELFRRGPACRACQGGGAAFGWRSGYCERCYRRCKEAELPPPSVVCPYGTYHEHEFCPDCDDRDRLLALVRGR